MTQEPPWKWKTRVDCVYKKLIQNAEKTGSKEVGLFYFILSSIHKRRYFSSRLNMKDFLIILKQTSLQTFFFLLDKYKRLFLLKQTTFLPDKYKFKKKNFFL